MLSSGETVLSGGETGEPLPPCDDAVLVVAVLAVDAVLVVDAL